MATQLLTPVGRLVGGSPYKPVTTDQAGNPLTVKTGPNKGQPTQKFNLGIAIPKVPGQDWKQTEWGQVIYNTGVAEFPNGEHARQDFAWKITDGDSQAMNKNNKRPCDNPNYVGHWILWFSSSFAPDLYNRDGSQRLVGEDQIKLGYYVQVLGTVAGNKNMQNPGVYLNGNMVSLQAQGEEIVVGPDAAAVGFGQGVQLPPGAQPVNSAPVTGGIGAPGAVQQHTQILNPPPPPPPPATPSFVMTPAANGATRDQMKALGWTDEQLIANGYMVQS